MRFDNKGTANTKKNSEFENSSLNTQSKIINIF